MMRRTYLLTLIGLFAFSGCNDATIRRVAKEESEKVCDRKFKTDGKKMLNQYGKEILEPALNAIDGRVAAVDGRVSSLETAWRSIESRAATPSGAAAPSAPAVPPPASSDRSASPAGSAGSGVDPRRAVKLRVRGLKRSFEYVGPDSADALAAAIDQRIEIEAGVRQEYLDLLYARAIESANTWGYYDILNKKPPEEFLATVDPGLIKCVVDDTDSWYQIRRWMVRKHRAGNPCAVPWRMYVVFYRK